MEPNLRVFVDRRSPRPVVAFAGELDICTTASFDEQVRGLRGDVAAVDARYVTFIDAAGIAALVRLGSERPLPVVASPAVERLIRVCALDEHLIPTAAPTPAAFDDAPFGVLEIGDDDEIAYANRLVADRIGVPASALTANRWPHVLALRALRGPIGEARAACGPACVSAVTSGPGPALRWTLWPLDRAIRRRRLVAIGDPI